jgi:IPT/TIG domain/PASTA domain
MKRPMLSALAVLAALLAVPASSQAQLLTVGELAPPNPPANCTNGPFEVFPAGTAVSTYRVPSAGVITSWSTNAAAGAGQTLSFKVYRPLGNNQFLVVGHDGPRPLLPSVLNTFPTQIQVQAGDLIGDNDENATSVPNACEFVGAPGDAAGYKEGTLGDGAIFEEEGATPGERPNVSATLHPAPTASSISPASGPIAGGTSVTIDGTNFAEVRSVSFGGAFASYRVNGEGQIVATAPSSATLASVPVTVTTLGGSATAPQSFSYQGCVVPKLRGKKLKATKKTLRRVACRIGKVKKLGDATAKTGKVVKQSQKPGQILPPGSTISVKLRD